MTCLQGDPWVRTAMQPRHPLEALRSSLHHSPASRSTSSVCCPDGRRSGGVGLTLVLTPRRKLELRDSSRRCRCRNGTRMFVVAMNLAVICGMSCRPKQRRRNTIPPRKGSRAIPNRSLVANVLSRTAVNLYLRASFDPRACCKPRVILQGLPVRGTW